MTNYRSEQAMSRIMFIPLTDEMLFDRPDLITGPITTYRPAISEYRSRSVSSMRSVQVPVAYLKGDLVNGLDVVYQNDLPTG